MQEIYFFGMNVQNSCSCNEYFRPRTMCFRAEPLPFFEGGASWFSAKTSKVHPKSSQCHPGAGSGWISWVYPVRTRQNHTENAWNLDQGPASLRACIAPASHWSFAPGSVANSPLFQHTSYLCSTVSLWVGVQNSSIVSFRFQSRKNDSPMGVHNAQLSPACTPITPYLA